MMAFLNEMTEDGGEEEEPGAPSPGAGAPTAA